jgi:hypothetical protein
VFPSVLRQTEDREKAGPWRRRGVRKRAAKAYGRFPAFPGGVSLPPLKAEESSGFLRSQSRDLQDIKGTLQSTHGKQWVTWSFDSHLPSVVSSASPIS